MKKKISVIQLWAVLGLPLSFLVADYGHATTARAAEIFDKKNRVLEPPPKNLRADTEAKEFRLKSEAKRVETGLKEESLAESASEAFSDGDSKSLYKSLKNKIKNRDALRRGAGFNGDRVFGIGFVGAGSYGIFAAEADFGVGDDFSVGMGLGTGMSYSTWGLYGRFFLKQGQINSFLQFGYANWYMGKVPSSPSELAPQYLTERFFLSRAGELDGPRRIHLFYPSIGVLYQHQSGLAATAQLQYLINMQDFFGGMAGSLGFHYYF